MFRINYMHKHQLFTKFLVNRELDELYISIAIRSLALAMISVFIPIYLLKLDYSLKAVFLFMAIFQFTHAIITIPAAKFASSKGFKHCILISVPLLILFYGLLYFLGSKSIPLFVLAIIYGISSAFFWMGFHTDFSKSAKKEKRGKEIGLMRIIMLVFSTIGPLIGGIIAAFSFNLLFLIGSILIFISVFPLFLSMDIHEKVDFSIKKVFTDTSFKRIAGFVGYGIEVGVSNGVWPIFIFLGILKTVTSLGIVTSLAIFISIFSAYLISKVKDKNMRKTFHQGAFIAMFLNLIIIFTKTVFQAYFFNILITIKKTFLSIPYDEITYYKAKKKGIVEVITMREMYANIARGSLYLFIAFIPNFYIAFVIGAISSFLYLIF